MTKNWFEEIDAKETVGLKLRVTEKLFSKKSPFQQVDIYQTADHGRLLVHDGAVMATERDEFIYHDMITHVPLFTHPNPKNVLIIGGGDGGTAREVLRHPTVQKVIMVEIDPVVVDAAREWLPQTSKEFSNPKLKIEIADGVEFVKKTKEKFDVVIVDSSDPIGPATPLFNIDFYRDVHSCLTDDGIVVSQCESPHYHKEMQGKVLSILHDLFPMVHLYTYTNLTYPGGYWGFSFASKKYCPVADFDGKRADALNCKYYNSQLHLASFQLPTFVRDNYKAFLTPLPRLTVSR